MPSNMTCTWRGRKRKADGVHTSTWNRRTRESGYRVCFLHISFIGGRCEPDLVQSQEGNEWKRVGESGVVFGVIKMKDIVGCSSVGGSHLARNRLTLNAATAAPPSSLSCRPCINRISRKSRFVDGK